MDTDDMPGYIMDYVEGWADNNGVSRDNPILDEHYGEHEELWGQSSEEFMADILRIAGYLV